MSNANTGLVNYSQQAPGQPPVSSALDGIRERIAQITANCRDMHGIADRACGQTVAAEAKSAVPQVVPNGMLDEIENALDALLSLSNGAVARLSRIA